MEGNNLLRIQRPRQGRLRQVVKNAVYCLILALEDSGEMITLRSPEFALQTFRWQYTLCDRVWY